MKHRRVVTYVDSCANGPSVLILLVALLQAPTREPTSPEWNSEDFRFPYELLTCSRLCIFPLFHLWRHTLSICSDLNKYNVLSRAWMQIKGKKVDCFFCPHDGCYWTYFSSTGVFWDTLLFPIWSLKSQKKKTALHYKLSRNNFFIVETFQIEWV